MLNNYKFFKTRDGVELRTRPIERDKKVWIVAIHGLGEHLDRHNYLVDILSHKFNVFQYDLRGHGRSGGRRAYVENFNDFTGDLLEMLNCLKKTYKMDKFILFGHSMGGLIATDYIKNAKDSDPYPEAVVLSSPPVWVGGILGKLLSPIPTKVFSVAAKMKQSVALPGLLDLDSLSGDARIKEEFLQDELNAKKLHFKLIMNLINSSREVYATPLRSKVPLYCSVGSKDRIVDVDAISKYFGQVELGGQVKIFENGFHELHNEVEKIKDEYFKYLINIMDLINS